MYNNLENSLLYFHFCFYKFSDKIRINTKKIFASRIVKNNFSSKTFHSGKRKTFTNGSSFNLLFSFIEFGRITL